MNKRAAIAFFPIHVASFRLFVVLVEIGSWPLEEIWSFEMFNDKWFPKLFRMWKYESRIRWMNRFDTFDPSEIGDCHWRSENWFPWTTMFYAFLSPDLQCTESCNVQCGADFSSLSFSLTPSWIVLVKSTKAIQKCENRQYAESEIDWEKEWAHTQKMWYAREHKKCQTTDQNKNNIELQWMRETKVLNKFTRNRIGVRVCLRFVHIMCFHQH